MAAGNRSAKIRQAGRNHRSQVPRTVNPDLHDALASRPKPAPKVALRQPADAVPLLYLQPDGRLFNAREGNVPRAMARLEPE